MDFYGTIGPACADAALLQQMVEAGMTGIRMNLSHGPLAAHADWLALLRKAGVKKLLIDLQGPELRIGRLPQPLSLTAGQTVRLGAQGIPCPAALVHSVQPGQELLLDDGKLLARVDVVLRRYQKNEAVLHVGGLDIDTYAMQVRRGKEVIGLTKKEYDLLLLFAQNPRRALYRETIYERVWGEEYQYGSKTVDLHVQRLRKKVGWEDRLQAVNKVGYRLEV